MQTTNQRACARAVTLATRGRGNAMVMGSTVAVKLLDVLHYPYLAIRCRELSASERNSS